MKDLDNRQSTDHTGLSSMDYGQMVAEMLCKEKRKAIEAAKCFRFSFYDFHSLLYGE